jgi:hypothetical protein
MTVIKTGSLNGQDIWRFKTAYERLWEALEIAKTKQLGNPSCPTCEGSGTAYIPDGVDDVVGEECGCVEIYQNNNKQ